ELREAPLPLEVAVDAERAPLTPADLARVDDEPAVAVGHEAELRHPQRGLGHHDRRLRLRRRFLASSYRAQSVLSGSFGWMAPTSHPEREEPDMTQHSRVKSDIRDGIDRTAHAVAAGHDAFFNEALESVSWERRGLLGR